MRIGLDFYNQCLTGRKSKTIAAGATKDSLPGLLEIRGGKSFGIKTSPGMDFQLGEETSLTLTAQQGKEGVLQMDDDVKIYENHAQDARYRDCGDCSPSLIARMGTGGNNVPLLQKAYTKGAHPQNCEEGQTYNEAEVAKTLRTFGTAASEMAGEELVCSRGMSVRRLMPVECERLMGFPDGHTIPAFAEITDELVERFTEIDFTFRVINWDKEKSKPGNGCIRISRKSPNVIRKWLQMISRAKTCPDSPRYKACGNSMCVNCMEWIGRRIQMVDDKIKQEEAAK